MINFPMGKDHTKLRTWSGPEPIIPVQYNIGTKFYKNNEMFTSKIKELMDTKMAEIISIMMMDMIALQKQLSLKRV